MHRKLDIEKQVTHTLCPQSLQVFRQPYLIRNNDTKKLISQTVS